MTQQSPAAALLVQQMLLALTKHAAVAGVLPQLLQLRQYSVVVPPAGTGVPANANDGRDRSTNTSRRG
jgi:hypothetical protein